MCDHSRFGVVDPLSARYRLLRIALVLGLILTSSCDIFNPDKEQPSFYIETPEDGATITLDADSLKTAITIIANVPEGQGIASVACYVDTVLLGEKSAPPYTWTWVATMEDTGSHTITVIARDDSGNERETAIHVTLIEATYYALQFDGVSGYVEIVDDSTLQIVDQLTLEAWIKFAAGGEGGPRLISKGADGQGYELMLTGDTGQEGVQLWIAPGEVGANATLYAGEWYHVAATYDGAMIFIYINGIEDINGPYSGKIATSTVNLFIGQKSEPGYDKFKGMIDEVRIWNVARSLAEIQANKDHEISGTESGLVGYWRFNEGSGDTAFDQTSNHNDGTLHGGVTWVISTAPINP